ncbi:CHAT domain-containing protein, partial [Mycena capillaripes]
EEKIEIIEDLISQTPRGHSDLPQYREILADAYIWRYSNLANPASLEEDMQKYRETVGLTPADHLDWAGLLLNLGVAFRYRSQRLGDLKDLNSAMQKFRDALDLIAAGHPDEAARKAECMEEIAGSFGDRFRKLRNITDLVAAVQTSQRAVDLTPANHPDKARRLEYLVGSFENRYRRLGHLEDLDSAQQRFREALDLTSADHPDRLEYLHGLTITCQHRFVRLGKLEDLEAAVQTAQEAANLAPTDHPYRAELLQSLATTFRDRYERLGDVKHLEAAIQNYQEAVNLKPVEHPDRAGILQGLAVSFITRYRRLGDPSDLESAVQKADEAVECTPDDHPHLPEHLQFLAMARINHFERWGDLRDLQMAIQKYQEALDLTLADYPGRAQCLKNLAVSLVTRYRRLQDFQDLETALKKFHEARDLISADHPDWTVLLRDLGVAYKYRYQRSGDLKDLDLALQKFHEAVNLIPANFPERAGYLQDLAVAFSAQYQRSGNLNNFEAAMRKYKEALDLTPETHPDKPGCLQGLAITSWHRFVRLGNLDDLEVALQTVQEAVNLAPIDDPYGAELLQSLAMFSSVKYETTKNSETLEAVHIYYKMSFKLPPLDLESSWHAALQWASFAYSYQPSYTLTAYETAFNLLPEILWIGHTIQVRHAAIHRLNLEHNTSKATRICIQLSDQTTAVKIMEQGLATTFQQIFQLKADVDSLPAGQRKPFIRLSSALYGGKLSNSTDVAIERRDVIQDIQKQPGYEYFLLPKPYSALCQASQNGPIMMLNSHENDCDGIIILNPTSEPVHVPLRGVTSNLLKAQQTMLRELLGRCNARMQGESDPTRLNAHRESSIAKTTNKGFEDLLTWLWEKIVHPVYQVLASGRLWWLPTGAFIGLPLHASPPTDEFIHSYTATLGSLLEAQAKKPASIPDKVGIVAVTHTGPGRQNYLKGVEQEVHKICAVLKSSDLKCLKGTQATPEAVTVQLQNCSWVHLACHGVQNLHDIPKSHLMLYEGNLELNTILQMPLLNSQFVFLAACQTAMGDSKLVNESFHLGGGFIAAGFRSAVGTLWSMNDQDGPLLAETFYSCLFRDHKKPQASDTAEALQLAVKELKVRKVPYERWIPFIHLGI